jgi:hypothetical protein
MAMPAKLVISMLVEMRHAFVVELVALKLRHQPLQ